MQLRVPLILASQSPRRAELLTQIGLSFSVCPADIDESPKPGEQANHYVLRMAEEKASALAGNGQCAVLGADTAVIIDGKILGKPVDRNEAATMLRRLQGRCHQVYTAIALLYGGRCRSELVVTEVQFAPLEAAQIADYLASGEADDKAGGYGIQGRAGAFVSSLSGSYSAVVGLPLCETVAMLRAQGLIRDE